MGIMCNFMDNGLDGELVKNSPNPVKNKKIYTRIGGSIAGEATKLVKTVKKGDGVAAYKVLQNAFGNKRSLCTGRARDGSGHQPISRRRDHGQVSSR